MATDSASISPVESAISATRRLPACPATPVPSAVTLRCGRHLLRFTFEVPSWIGTDGLSTFSFPYQEGVFADYCTAKLDANETCGLGVPPLIDAKYEHSCEPRYLARD